MSRNTATRDLVISRRTALLGAFATAITAPLVLQPAGAAHSAGESAMGSPVEPAAGLSTTWILASGDQFRPGTPPDEMTTASEIAAVKREMSRLDDAGRDRIAYWDAGSPGSRWNEIALQHISLASMPATGAYRVMALVNGAIHDATVAIWDAKYAWNRPRPALTDGSIRPLLPTPASPSYPSEHAATAAAAAAVLGCLFLADTATFERLSREAASSRVAAGVAFPSDVSTGLALGYQVGRLYVEHARADGLDTAFDNATPPGRGRRST
jgi:hypothetical protein